MKRMRIAIASVVVAMAVAAAHVRRADACSEDGRPQTAAQLAANAPDIFNWFERAELVVQVDVLLAPGISIEGHGLAGNVTYAAHASIKGKARATFISPQPLQPCAGATKGDSYIGFFDADNHLLGSAPTTRDQILLGWAAARTPADQAAFLAKLVADKDAALAGAAQKRIAIANAWRQPAKGWKRPGTAAIAVARAKQLWPAILAASSARGPLANFDDAMTHGQCKLEATKRSCAAELKQITSVANPSDLGEVDALAGATDCWDVSCAVAFWTLNIYIDAADGHALLIWIPPEG